MQADTNAHTYIYTDNFVCCSGENEQSLRMSSALYCLTRNGTLSNLAQKFYVLWITTVTVIDSSCRCTYTQTVEGILIQSTCTATRTLTCRLLKTWATY